ncbi:ectonucleoside triphosphate diphosphohydrolase 1-like isoform X2 [Uloborus diversus]|uniref:ectonucleoside triphosphate diphosphohydrolase 1-like isoform X2 n=1 Tax=Uloborus diversus TaxID=327109 RepID=UPI0024098C48|nr:ectonucleoside triphosphate diphosphohydrolase 1-like isoform X2 [Uloborus diversus]
MIQYSHYEQLSNMYTVFVESNLAKPLSGALTLEVSPTETAQDVVNNFLLSLQREDGIPGLAIFDKNHRKLDWDTTLESQGILEGSKLYISYDSQLHIRPVHIAVVGIITVIISSILLIAASVLFGATGGDIPFDYGIVIDAGSTHTEIFLYQWSGSKQLGTGKVHQKSFCKNDEGIADVPDPDTIVACVRNVTNSLPSDKSISPVLYLGATGGMRLLNMSSSMDSDLILMALKYALSTTPVDVRSVGIIPGKIEGLYSWITTNFLTETIQQEKILDTYGALDLGGASTQYAYALDINSTKNYSDATLLKLYGHEYYVRSESFLCFGLSKAMDRNQALIFMDQNEILDPCLPLGYSAKKKAKSFFQNPCVYNEYFAKWLREHPKEDEKIVITGDGNYPRCQKYVQKLIDEENCKISGFPECLHKANITHHNDRYMAFASFYHIVTYLNGSGSLEKFIAETKEFCNLTWDQVKERSHSKGELSHLLTYCFGAVYVTELLVSNYGFNYVSWRSISFKNRIKGADVGWSLGYMINATNAIPEESPTPPVISLTVFVPLCILCSILILAAVMLLRKTLRFITHKKYYVLADF